MENIFNSNENKSFIWNLIYEQGGFNDIPESRIDNIKVLLDDKVKNIINNDNFENTSTIELNKILLKSLFDDLKIYKINENKTVSAKKEENINDFNKKLEDYKNDMNDILNIKPPSLPNFEDNNSTELKDVSESYDKLLKLRSIDNNMTNNNMANNNMTNNNMANNNMTNNNMANNNMTKKTSFLTLSTELFNNNESILNSKEEFNNNINLSPNEESDSNYKIEALQINSNSSFESVLSISMESIEYIDNSENNTILYINKNLNEIKKLEKIINNKNLIDVRTENNFNINNKLNLIINKIDELSKKYDNLEEKFYNFSNE